MNYETHYYKMKTKGKLKARLGVGPMSSETIEAVFRHSHFFRRQLMLISSKNQIDAKGGYVNNWTTKQYMEAINVLRKRYPQSDVKICRDHCGPGFNGIYDLKDSYRTIEDDIKNGFDLIHIDFCHFQGSNRERLTETKRAIQFALKKKPSILLEIGTDENEGTNYTIANIGELEREIDFFQEFCKPEFYVVQTSSLIMEINQVGSFNKAFIERISKLLDSKEVKLKEHNADYLSKNQIALRDGYIGAFNIAPQLGVVQTSLTLTKCLTYGIQWEKFADLVYTGGRWKKWLQNNGPENKMLCVLIAGHYHFSSPLYQEILRQLGEHEDIQEIITNQLADIIAHYDKK